MAQAGSRRPDLRIYDAVVEALLENAGRISQLVVRGGGHKQHRGAVQQQWQACRSSGGLTQQWRLAGRTASSLLCKAVEGCTAAGRWQLRGQLL